MDPLLRTSLAIGIGVMLKNIMLDQWNRYQEVKRRQPIPMKLRNGVYVPWGPVQKIQRVINIALVVWLIWIAGMVIVLILS